MLGPLIVSFDHATREGVVEGSLQVSDLDDAEVGVGCAIGVVDSGAGPYEAEVIAVEGDRIRVRAPALSVPRSKPGLADVEDIQSWAGTYQARSELPRLVRRLLADTPGVTGLSIRAGTGVDFSGWDGRIDGGSGTAYVPAGLSCWEMSTSQDPKAQARKNYRNRTKDPEGADPATTTFVFVTPRRWSDKDKWEQARRAEGIWHNVRVLDADDLAGWLESRYCVHVWLSEHLGLRPGDVETIEGWWSRWSAATDPPLPAGLLLARRTDEAGMLRSKLDGNPSVTGIKAGSRDEATAFVAAVLHTSQDTDHLAKSFVVASAPAWEHSVSTQGRSVLIPTFDGADVGAALSAGHHVVVPMGVDDPGQAIELPRLGRSEARAVFESIGIELDRADRLAVRARRSLTSLRRALSVNPRAARPGWAQGTDGDMLGVLVLVGAWSDTREADQKLVAEIANRDYESVERLLRRWENTGDPPFRRSGNSWRLANPEDAWALLNDRIIRDDLERWRNAVLNALGTRDPVLDLDPQGRFMASVRGDEHRWSFDLRSGLAQGVALLAALGLPRDVDGRQGSAHAESLVRNLLDRAGEDGTGKLWQQLSDVLPRLAEAAPDAFLDAVRRDSTGEAPLIGLMFTDGLDSDPPWNQASPHTGILWALETICWSSDHLPEVLGVLMRLAEIDPGGRLANRPIDSAANVLSPWRPQTGAPLDRRLAVLEGLLQRHPQVGQELSSRLLSRSFSSNAHRPRFRDWTPDSCQITEGEFQESKHVITDRTLAVIQRTPSKLVQWIDQLPQLVVEARRGVIKCLHDLDEESLDDADRSVLWESLDRLSNRYSDRIILEKHLFPGGLQMLDTIMARLRPETENLVPGVQERDLALFRWDPTPEDDRQEAVRSVYRSGGLRALLELTAKVDCPTLVGAAAAAVFGDSQLLDLLSLMSRSTTDHELAMSWIRNRARMLGMEWVQEVSGSLDCLPRELRALFFRSVEPRSHVWNLLDTQDVRTRRIYWQSINDLVVPPCDVSRYISYLLEYDRPWLATRVVYFGLGKDTDLPVSVDVIENILAGLCRSRSKQVVASSNAYQLGKLLDVLEMEKPDSEVLIPIELALFMPLQFAGRTPMAIHRRLRADPRIFVDLVCLLNSDKSEMHEGASVPTEVAWSVLHEWKDLPGTDPASGEINYTKLRDWVIQARRLFEEYHQTEIGDMYIGELLSRSPTGEDGVWPVEEVRDLLEEMDDDVLEEGLVSRATDLGGMPMRGLYEGGQQERDQADQYRSWARQVDYSWPRTGRVLRQIAKSYDSYASLADVTSERFADLD